MATSSAAAGDTTGEFSRSFDVTATADADTTINITHGITGATASNLKVCFEPLLANHYVSTWTVTARTSTTITLTKGTATGSGNASAQTRVHIWREHSITD